MKSARIIWGAGAAAALAAGIGVAVFVAHRGRGAGGAEETEQVRPLRETLRVEVVTTGSVLPQNRLEVKPPIAGRVEELLVEEGSPVRKGQVLGLMSSSERAALMDAAAARGSGETAYWAGVYKPTSIVSPIDGDVIVRPVEPGQTVAAGAPVLVLSDRLIVKARVDESDVGGVKTGQTASVKLDAYPDVRATGTVQHISHESRVVNNVVIYEVEVVLPAIPDVFRSGMSAEVAILQKERENALTLPADAVERGADGAWVTVSRRGGEEKRAVRLGISDGRKVEILDGVGEADTVLLRRKVYALPKGEEQRSSPLVPFGGGRRHR